MAGLGLDEGANGANGANGVNGANGGEGMNDGEADDESNDADEWEGVQRYKARLQAKMNKIKEQVESSYRKDKQHG